MRPIFEQAAPGAAAPCRFVEQGEVIRAETGEERQVMGPREHVDAVDLEQAKPIDRSPEMRLSDRGFEPGAAEPLGGERDAPRLVSGECVFQSSSSICSAISMKVRAASLSAG